MQTGCCLLALDFDSDDVVCDIFQLLLDTIKCGCHWLHCCMETMIAELWFWVGNALTNICALPCSEQNAQAMQQATLQVRGGPGSACVKGCTVC